MRALVLNAKKSYGVKKSDGTPYEMYIVTISLPLKEFSSSTYNMTGYGHDIAELPLDPQAFIKFAELKEPRVLDLQLESAIMFGDLKQVVVGFSIPAARPA